MHRNTQLLICTVLLLFSDPVLGSEHTERKVKHSTEGSITEYAILTIGTIMIWEYIFLICNSVSESVSIPQKETNPFGLSYMHIFMKS